MDSTFRNETPWKHEYWNRYRARQRLDDALGRYVPHRSSRSTSTLNSFFSALTPRCAFGRAPNQHGVTVLTVPADRSDALARSRNPEIRILCVSFQSPPEGEGGREKWCGWHPRRGNFARSLRVRHIFWTATGPRGILRGSKRATLQGDPSPCIECARGSDSYAREEASKILYQISREISIFDKFFGNFPNSKTCFPSTTLYLKIGIDRFNKKFISILRFF